jgi:uncharacterized protein YgiB involved in biofilm formation
MTDMTPPARKRGRKGRLILAGTAALSLAACKDDSIEAQVFENVDACRAEAARGDGALQPEDCEVAFAEAERAHSETAPRYASAELCQEEHGEGCLVEQRNDGTSVFLPLMAGYMIGNMMSNSRNAQPLYRTGSGQYSTASRNFSVSGLNGSTRAQPSAFRAQPSTVTAAPMTRATVRSSGGFGGRAGGSFGG